MRTRMTFISIFYCDKKLRKKGFLIFPDRILVKFDKTCENDSWHIWCVNEDKKRRVSHKKKEEKQSQHFFLSALFLFNRSRSTSDMSMKTIDSVYFRIVFSLYWQSLINRLWNLWVCYRQRSITAINQRLIGNSCRHKIFILYSRV